MLYLITLSLAVVAANLVDIRAEWELLHESIRQSMPSGTTLVRCVEEYREQRWWCTPKLAIAAAGMSEAAIADNRLCYDFVRHCQAIYISRAKMSLSIFEPVAEFILKSKQPVCSAISGVYWRVRQLSEYHMGSSLPWKNRPKMRELRDLVDGMRKLEAAKAQDNERFHFGGLIAGCNVDKIWEEFIEVRGPTRGWKGCFSDFCELAALMEKVNADQSCVVNFYLEHVDSIVRENMRRFGEERVVAFEKKSTAYSFFYGQNVDDVICLLVAGERVLTEECKGRLYRYLRYLDWRGQVNWWDFKLGLLRSGLGDSKEAGEMFCWIKSKLMEEGGDLAKALQHMGKLENLGEQNIKRDTIDDLLEWLHQGREGASSLWKGGGRVRNVKKHMIHAMVQGLERLSSNKTEGFYNFVVQSLPRRGVLWRHEVTHDLGEGLYKNVIEGRNALQFMAEILNSGERSGCLEARARSVRNAGSYLKYLSPQLSMADLFCMLAQVPDQAGGSFVVVDLVWSAINARAGRCENSALWYLDFVLSNAELDQVYLQKEVQAVRDYLRACGCDVVALCARGVDLDAMPLGKIVSAPQ